MNTLKDIFKTCCQTGAMLLLIGASVWFGFACGRTSLVTRDSSLVSGYVQPSIEQQIQFLESQGFDCGTPKDKAGPRFCDALNRWQCDQYAGNYFQPQISQMDTDSK